MLAAEIKLVAAARVVALQPPLLLEDANVLVGLDVLVVEAPLLDLGLVLTRAVLVLIFEDELVTRVAETKKKEEKKKNSRCLEKVDPLHRVHDVLELLRLVKLLDDAAVRLPVFRTGRSNIVHAGRHLDPRRRLQCC